MTNAEIIYNARMQLAKDGKIATVDGEPEEIHTFKKWRELGYTVLRGEKAICKLGIWKPVQKKGRKPEQEPDEDDKKEPAPWMVAKTAFFFSRSQVDALV